MGHNFHIKSDRNLTFFINKMQLAENANSLTSGLAQIIAPMGRNFI